MAYLSIDMSRIRNYLGDAYHADEDLFVVDQWYYFGDFSYMDDEWNGTITKVQFYDEYDNLVVDVSRLDLDTRYATVGATAQQAFRSDDDFRGSRGNDGFSAYAGNDTMRGGNGDDTLSGGSGNDQILGQSGRDLLRGGAGRDDLLGGTGNDRLRGESGNDSLTGGTGADTFIFTGDDGKDRLEDFDIGQDTIRITSGAEDFSDLRIRTGPNGVSITFDDTILHVYDVRKADLDASDFVFG